MEARVIFASVVFAVSSCSARSVLAYFGLALTEDTIFIVAARRVFAGVISTLSVVTDFASVTSRYAACFATFSFGTELISRTLLLMTGISLALDFLARLRVGTDITIA